MPDKDKKEEKPKDIDETIAELHAVGEDSQAPGVQVEKEDGKPGKAPPMLTPVEMQRLQENMRNGNQNAFQLGNVSLQLHQLEEMKKDLLNKANNIILDNNRLMDGARKRLKLPDDHMYNVDPQTGMFIDRGPKPLDQ